MVDSDIKSVIRNGTVMPLQGKQWNIKEPGRDSDDNNGYKLIIEDG